MQVPAPALVPRSPLLDSSQQNWPAFLRDGLAVNLSCLVRWPGSSGQKAMTVPGSSVCSKFHVLYQTPGARPKAAPSREPVRAGPVCLFLHTHARVPYISNSLAFHPQWLQMLVIAESLRESFKTDFIDTSHVGAGMFCSTDKIV